MELCGGGPAWVAYLKLPQVLQFFSGNMPTLTFWDGIAAVRLKLREEDSGRLMTWREARRVRGPSARRVD